MDMEIVGRHSLLFDDDAMAAFVNSGDALVEWHSLQIDRYDVRHLLSAPPPPRRRNRSYEPRTSDDPSIEFLINQERYLDLPLESNQPELEKEEEEEEEEEEKPSNSGGYHAIAFSYGNTDDSADQKDTDIEMEARGYLPPFSVPGDIVLPPTEKVHQIIARTAIFVSKHGGQSEIILRVKQGDNPTFGFLMPDHHLHTYFRYLVEHPELLHPEIDEKSQDGRKMVGTEHNNSGNIGGALSLLGSVYGSGEDEDADDAANASPSHDAKNMESVETSAKDESVSGKSILSKKDKVPAVKKNSSIVGSKHKSVKGIKKEDNSCAKEEKLRSHGIGATSKPILEPPPELKRMVDKLVEFVTRNGRQFEATLLEQDSKLERFPFLLSSNQYHLYYLKALEAAQESKLNGKSIYPGQEDLGGRGISRKGSLLKEKDISHSTSELCDVPFESDRKEKFKMVIGKSKKDSQETEKESQECGFTVDAAAAAAILQAATKGIKSSGLRYITNTASSSHINAVRNEDGQPANSGNLQPLLLYSTGEKSDQSGSCNPSSSHEVAGGDDSSNSNLTEEQKLKAMRLKRAKMFVAMLKSGALPSRTGASRGSSAEPVEYGVLKSAAEARCASQEREGSAPAAVNKSAVEDNFGERQSDRQSKRKYHSKSIGSEDDEEDSDREGHLIRKRRRSRRPEDDENDNAVEKEHRYNQEKGRHRSHSTEDNKNEGESSDENKDYKHTKSLRSSHRSQVDDDESEGICKEDIEAKDSGHHPERKYRSRSQREDEEVENAVEKGRKHLGRKRRSHFSSEECENGEESDGQDAEHKHYKSKHPSRRSQRDDNGREGAYKEESDKEHKRSHASRSRRHEGKNAVEKEDKKYRRKHSSHLSYEENGGSSGDEMEHHRSKSSHSKHKNDGHEDIYKEEKDRKRSRKSCRSRHSSSESPIRQSSERHKKHRSSRKSHHSKDKHRHRHRKDRESHNRHKHDSSSDDEHQRRASSGHPEKGILELEEGEISSKDDSKGIVTGDGKRGTSVDVTSSEPRAPSLPSETTEVPADLRAKIRAMLMATRS